MNLYDYIIVGNGFKALSSAHALSKISNKVKVIYDSKNFYGTMSALPVNDDNIDLGYHFFDGLNDKSEKFIRDLCSGFELKNFGYGAATYTNKQLYYFHAIPNYQSFGFKFIVINFFKLVFINLFIKKKNTYDINLEDFYINYPKDIKKFILSGIKRNYTIDAKYLSFKAKNYTPISCERITILNSKLSSYLKKINFFDNFLACRRDDLSLEKISLYPNKKNMLDLGMFIRGRLEKKGVKFVFSEKIKIQNYDDYKICVNEDNKKSFTKNLIFLKDLDSAEKYFNLNFDQNSNFYVPQILFVFEQKNIVSKFQYVMGNDLNLIVTRATNLSLYSKKSTNNYAYVIAEVPTNTNSEIWNNPDKFIDEVWNNLIDMGLSKEDEKYVNFKYFKAKKTFCLPTKNYEKNMKIFNNFIKKNFKSKLRTIGSSLIGRHDFIIDLLENIENEKIK